MSQSSGRSSKSSNERIRWAVEGSTPPLRPGVRKRALRAAMAGLRRRSKRRTAVLVVLALLLVGTAACLVLRMVPR